MFQNIFARFLRRPATAVVASPRLNEAERGLIRQFVSGDQSARDKALTVYRDAVGRGVPLSAEVALRFMSEVDTSNPDLMLRSSLRTELLHKW